ncbi:MAG: hypothetical protein DM484_05995 [Candidatus Methylumidiphilus alinenensis]|uniref:DUF6817 domain-containing protein n=1 Tax=Candidatus Methylumidiphilus alinenensis TaxID=2202197 RepID=A0A2W4TJK5_9GAMM|nr:MAG: hypothetical protein DM484_05995 [Candidatus Methylumidiphilus alinenensis]
MPDSPPINKPLSINTIDEAIAGGELKSYPYPHLIIDGLFPAAEAADLRDWLRSKASWWLQERDFYTHYSCNNLDDCPLVADGHVLSPAVRSIMATRLAERFNIALDTRHVSLCAHRMQAGHGIGVHNDDPVLGTEALRLMVTLNDEDYKHRDGGQFCLFASSDPSSLTAIMGSIHNLGVAFLLGDNSYHAVNDVSHGERLSLVFGFWEASRVAHSVMPRRNAHGARTARDLAGLADAEAMVGILCERGANLIEHSGATLLDHLIGVAALLRNWGCDDTLCRAGLFHSVYGTATFQHRLYAEWERAAVRAAIGEAAEAIVWLFSVVRFSEVYRYQGEVGYAVHRRDACTELTLSLDEVAALNTVALANSFEQADGPFNPGDIFEWRQAFAKLQDRVPPGVLRALDQLTE